MPGYDGTGPLGKGKKSGRGFGACRGEAGIGGQKGFGGGHWRGLCIARAITRTALLSKEEQTGILNERLKEIDAEKKAIESKLDELK
ncbi:MAG: DUF5320 domain-containing protein [Candidatus Micrarchaeota archaeon]